MKQYHIAKDEVQIGSFPEPEIQSMLASGKIQQSDLYWTEGMEGWRPLGDLPPRPSDVPPLLPTSQKGSNPFPVSARLGDNAGIRLLLPVGRSGWAIAAGYLGLFGLVIVPAPLALIVSIIAIRDIRKSKVTDKPKYGMGRAVFGLIVGIAGTVILLLVLLKFK